jgi:DNA topoisomerase I
MATALETAWWRRVGTREEGFRYVRSDGKPLTSPPGLERIRRLVIPPAWTDVHIAARAGAKIQAWGRDAAGRKQYIYHPDFRQRQDSRKWDRVLECGRMLPLLRARTNEHLQRPTLDREKVLATIVRLMTRAYFRVGSERYAVRNRTFGICTLAKRHVRIKGRTLYFRYAGKRRVDQRRVVADTPLVDIIEDLLELPGSRLFQYLDADGRARPVSAQEVNAYIRLLVGERYTSKDLRTFGGTVRAATILADLGPASSRAEARRNITLCCRLVAAELGNTPSICRASYIHPAVLSGYEEEGRTIEPLMRKRRRPVSALEPVMYYPEEAALIRFLEAAR